MSKFVHVNVSRSYNGSIKQPPDRVVDEKSLIDDERMLRTDLPIFSDMSAYYSVSRVTGLKFKGGI